MPYMGTIDRYKNPYICKGGCGMVTCNLSGTCLACPFSVAHCIRCKEMGTSRVGVTAIANLCAECLHDPDLGSLCDWEEKCRTQKLDKAKQIM